MNGEKAEYQAGSTWTPTRRDVTAAPMATTSESHCHIVSLFPVSKYKNSPREEAGGGDRVLTENSCERRSFRSSWVHRTYQA